MGINLKQIGKDILTAYIVIAVDVFGGFKVNLNNMNNIFIDEKLYLFLIAKNNQFNL